MYVYWIDIDVNIDTDLDMFHDFSFFIFSTLNIYFVFVIYKHIGHVRLSYL